MTIQAEVVQMLRVACDHDSCKNHAIITGCFRVQEVLHHCDCRCLAMAS